MHLSEKTPPTSSFRYAELLAPICAELPCGPNLEYDPAFVILQSATAQKSETQYGDFIGTPEPVNWPEIERSCKALLLRTKDIRLIIFFIRSRIRQDGAEGLRDGLTLLKTMLEHYPNQIHPSLHYEGQHDPVTRANALAGLAEHSGILADLRNITLPKSAGLELQLRDLERSFSFPRPKDALAPEVISRLLKELSSKRNRHFIALSEAQKLVEEIVMSIDIVLGAEAPDLHVLLGLLQPFQFAINQSDTNYSGETREDTLLQVVTKSKISAHLDPSAQGDLNTDHTTSVNTANQERMDRWTALATLQEVRQWFEQNEPSSPVIIVLRQGERMVGKRFSELAHIIPADLLVKWDETDE
ncbi:type VI secretion system protein TssA [Glaciimonas sp. GG7]